MWLENAKRLNHNQLVKIPDNYRNNCIFGRVKIQNKEPKIHNDGKADFIFVTVKTKNRTLTLKSSEL